MPAEAVAPPQAATPADRTRPLPLADRVILYLVKQPMSSWLLFLQGKLDLNALDKDNLDLSAKRATTVVRLLLTNEAINPERIIAAGRGESLPVAQGKTPEARAKNRRTEIILTPKLDELMQLMEQN